MIWLRKSVVLLLSLILFGTLIDGALSTSANITLAHPDKLEAWLDQSGFYNRFVNNAIDQAQKAADSSDLSVSFSDPQVKHAAQSAFTPRLLQQYVDTFFNSNYAWLEGKTSAPRFNIDLSGVKQTFAQHVGSAVQTYMTSLPVCSDTQLIQLRSQLQDVQQVDPFKLPCRPSSLDPKAEADQITLDVLGNTSLLRTTSITPSTLNPFGTAQSPGQVYYKRLSAAPKLYRFGVTLPWVYGAVALLSAIGIIFIGRTRRLGLRRVAVVLLLAGLVSAVTQYAADYLLKRLENKVSGSSDVSQLQPSLIGFLHRIESQLVKVDLWFAAGFLLAAALLLILLFITRPRAPQTPRASKQPPASTSAVPNADATPVPAPGASQPYRPYRQPPARPKPPRLIQ